MDTEKLMDTIKQGVVALFFLGIFGYAMLLVLYILNVVQWFDSGALKIFAEKSDKLVFGLPISGMTAFAIVCVFERLASGTENKAEKLSFKAFGLEFSGPAAPATLWIVCYLAIVGSMQMVS